MVPEWPGEYRVTVTLVLQVQRHQRIHCQHDDVANGHGDTDGWGLEDLFPVVTW